MLYAVMFQDDPDADPQIRPVHMARHLDFLTRNAGHILAAGPLTVPGDAPSGGLWLVEADSAAKVSELVQADPFWPTGLRLSVTIREWRRVFADGQRLV